MRPILIVVLATSYYLGVGIDNNEASFYRGVGTGTMANNTTFFLYAGGLIRVHLSSQKASFLFWTK